MLTQYGSFHITPSGAQASSNNPAYRPTNDTNDLDFERTAAASAEAITLVVILGLLTQTNFFRADLSHESGRSNDENGNKDDKPDCLFECGIDVVAGKAFDQAYNQTTEIGARDAAEAAEHDDCKSREDEVSANVRRERVDGCKEFPRNACQGRAGAERQQIGPFDIDAHQPRRLAILDDRTEGLARQR